MKTRNNILFALLFLVTAFCFSQTTEIDGKLSIRDTPPAAATDSVLAVTPTGTVVKVPAQSGLVSLFESFVPDSYLGQRYRFTDLSVNGFYWGNSDNQRNGITVYNDGTGSSATSSFVVSSSAAPFVNAASLQYFGANYFGAPLRNSGGLYANQTMSFTIANGGPIKFFSLPNTNLGGMNSTPILDFEASGFTWRAQRTTIAAIDAGIDRTLVTKEWVNDQGFSSATAPYITPIEYGAIPDDAIDDSAAFQAMFDAMGTADIPTLVMIPAGVYNIQTTIDIPRISGAAGITQTILGYGATLTTTATNISIFRQMPADQTAASTEISSSRLIVKGISFDGDLQSGQVAIEMGAQYSARIQDCTFDNLGKGVVVTFGLKTVIDNCRFTANVDNDLILQTAGDDIDGGGPVWTGGTVSNSASNASIVKDCRFFGRVGHHSNVAVLGSDQVVLNRIIVEGNGDGYGVFFDRQGSTLINSFVLDHPWFEGPSLQVNIKSNARGLVKVNHMERTLDVPLFDAAGTTSSNTTIEIDLPYIGNLSTPWFYHTGGDGISGTEGGGNYTSTGNFWKISTTSGDDTTMESAAIWENSSYPSAFKIKQNKASNQGIQEFSSNIRFFRGISNGQFWLENFNLLFPDNGAQQNIGKRGSTYFRPRGIYAGTDGLESAGDIVSIGNGSALTLRSPDGLTDSDFSIDNNGSLSLPVGATSSQSIAQIDAAGNDELVTKEWVQANTGGGSTTETVNISAAQMNSADTTPIVLTTAPNPSGLQIVESIVIAIPSNIIAWDFGGANIEIEYTTGTKTIVDIAGSTFEGTNQIVRILYPEPNTATGLDASIGSTIRLSLTGPVTTQGGSDFEVHITYKTIQVTP